MDNGMSHSMITYSCVAVNIIFIAVAYYFRYADCTVLILSLVTVASLATGIMYYTARKRKGRIEEFGTTPPAITSQILQLKNKSFSTQEQN